MLSKGNAFGSCLCYLAIFKDKIILNKIGITILDLAFLIKLEFTDKYMGMSWLVGWIPVNKFICELCSYLKIASQTS